MNAKLMVEILRRLGPTPSREKLEQTVFTMQDFDIGIGERVSFSPDRAPRAAARVLHDGGRGTIRAANRLVGAARHGVGLARKQHPKSAAWGRPVAA